MIKIVNLSKSYRKVTALQNISLHLEDSSSLVIQGPSGSGKTTLLRLIAGLEEPDDGEIFIDGHLASRPGKVIEPHLRKLGFVFQKSTLWPHMTVAQNIEFGIADTPKEQRNQIISTLLSQLGLAGFGTRYPNELSGGEARRVELARALAPRPRHILMDEPLVHLDTNLKSEMIKLIMDTIQDHNISLIYVTHDSLEGELISKNQIRLVNGKIQSG